MNLDIAIIVPIVIALVEVAKRIKLPDQYAPLLSIILGVAGAFIFPQATIQLTILEGLVFGLSASGLYSGVRASFNF
jgi:uncharacterized membrane protein YdjX (TVP38/TMEM64 family)